MPLKFLNRDEEGIDELLADCRVATASDAAASDSTTTS